MTGTSRVVPIYIELDVRRDAIWAGSVDRPAGSTYRSDHPATRCPAAGSWTTSVTPHMLRACYEACPPGFGPIRLTLGIDVSRNLDRPIAHPQGAARESSRPTDGLPSAHRSRAALASWPMSASLHPEGDDAISVLHQGAPGRTGIPTSANIAP